MKKPIIATTLSGLFIKSEPWKKAHIIWFKEASKKLEDNSVNEWADKPNYFEGVDIVMKRLYPKFSEKERTIKARETYFNSIIKYIKENPSVINARVVKYFVSLKQNYRLALITTNKEDSIKKILSLADLLDLFDIIEASKPEEKDDKVLVFKRFIKNYGKPYVYIGGDRKDSYTFCLENKIPCIFANFENSEDIKGIKNAHNLSELEFYLKLI